MIYSHPSNPREALNNLLMPRGMSRSRLFGTADPDIEYLYYIYVKGVQADVLFKCRCSSLLTRAFSTCLRLSLHGMSVYNFKGKTN